ncbi:MAG: hypothetical protein ABH882_03450 [Candidatus Omnitrophota bacterium]|nr:hypothetical protein [Candidatus Omnitrophota bacterium]MBU1929253.1 hypothetical protein [Candidatus Omnitrophota bacterium]MBU2034364.1 hypothetical protein [Candidatus Omnitrophota bacterium]MBU2221660.1 hypothetical protein [Candidatus Omnitrophota bacterium]MBU2258107.1 hypothetical protein [Candidatus Omnitrophota bacterium]
MDFNQLKVEIKNIPLQETRADRDDYLEVVINSEKITDISGILNRYFGLPAWPSDKEIQKGVKETIDKFGGIIKGQILYAKYENNSQTFAMIWPWQSTRFFTLKIGFKT